MYQLEEIINTIICGDTLTVLKDIPDESINCVVTSPPYWNLRNYDVEGQLGLEETFEEYIKKLCDIFDEVKRVLRKDGTCFVNLGDTYNSHTFGKSKLGGGLQKNLVQKNEAFPRYRKPPKNIDDKSLCLIPQRFAIEMVNRGWILRNVIIWHKPNCMPSSVKDRFTVDFESIYFFVKNRKYWFEQQFEHYDKPLNRWGGNQLKANGESNWDKGTGQETYRDRDMRPNNQGRNKRCVWTISTQSFSGAHFATFPIKLIEPMIKAGCPKEGLVLDPFMGSGTTALEALKQGKRFIGIELKQEYIDMAYKQISKVQSNLF